jgi:putative tricarboxylic transport membrane protein
MVPSPPGEMARRCDGVHWWTVWIMSRSNLAVSAGFFLLGLYLVGSAFELPAGMGRLPGPGFFPAVLGAVIMLLAVALFVQTARRREQGGFELDNARGIAGAIGLVFLYLLLWGSGWFALRTAVFLALLLRFLGQRWTASVAVGLALTAVVVGAFQYGLRISLE